MDSTIVLTLELSGIGIAIIASIFKFYTSTIKTLQNHDDRLSFIEFRLDRIEKKLDELNGRMKGNES